MATFTTFNAMGISISAHVHVTAQIVRPHGEAALRRKFPLTVAPTHAPESISLLELSRVRR